MPKLPLKPEGEPRGEVPAAEAPAEPSREELERAKKEMEEALKEETPEDPKKLIHQNGEKLRRAVEFIKDKLQDKQQRAKDVWLVGAPPSVREIYDRHQVLFQGYEQRLQDVYREAMKELTGISDKTETDMIKSEGEVEVEKQQQKKIETGQERERADVGLMPESKEVIGRKSEVLYRADLLSQRRTEQSGVEFSKKELFEHFEENFGVLLGDSKLSQQERERISQILHVQKDQLVYDSFGDGEVLLAKMETIVMFQMSEPDLLREQYKQLMKSMNDVSPKKRQTEGSGINSPENQLLVKRFNEAFHPDPTDPQKAKNIIDIARKFGIPQ